MINEHVHYDYIKPILYENKQLHVDEVTLKIENNCSHTSSRADKSMYKYVQRLVVGEK